MSDYSCPAHGDFITRELLKEHMVLEHPTSNPSKEFIEQVKRIESKPPPPPAVVPVKAPQVPDKPSLIVKKPLILKYRWEGSCPTCNRENIKTIMVKTARTLYSIAFCVDCDRDIKQLTVHPIETEIKEEPAKNSKIDKSFPKNIHRKKGE